MSNQIQLYLATIPVKCPNCAVKFNSRQLPVLMDTGIRNSELRQDFQGLIPQFEPYAICTCPSCGRSDWIKTFEAIKEIATLYQPSTTPHLQFRNAGILAEKENNNYKAGLLLLHAAWCADDSRAFPQAREYRRMAIQFFRRSLTDVSCPVTNRHEIEYLIGELLRRTGEFEYAKEHFRSVISRMPGPYAYMTRRLMRLTDLSNTELVRFERGA